MYSNNSYNPRHREIEDRKDKAQEEIKKKVKAVSLTLTCGHPYIWMHSCSQGSLDGGVGHTE